jgi:hypothetical protein
MPPTTFLRVIRGGASMDSVPLRSGRSGCRPSLKRRLCFDPVAVPCVSGRLAGSPQNSSGARHRHSPLMLDRNVDHFKSTFRIFRREYWIALGVYAAVLKGRTADSRTDSGVARHRRE